MLKKVISILLNLGSSGTTVQRPANDYPPHASVYATKSNLIFAAYGCNSIGLLVSCPPYIQLPINASDDDLGLAIINVIEAYQPQIEDPPEDKADRKEHKAQLKELGFRSNRQFQQEVICCLCIRDALTYKLTPTHNGGTSGDSKGFQPVYPTIELPLTITPLELGAALRQALALCTTIYP